MIAAVLLVGCAAPTDPSGDDTRPSPAIQVSLEAPTVPLVQAVDVQGVDEAEQVAGVDHIEITAKLRQKLVPLPEGASYLGFIFARADTPQQVEHSLRAAHSRLRFQISSAIPVL